MCANILRSLLIKAYSILYYSIFTKNAAFEEAEKNAPAIIFIDELDAIAPKRDKVGRRDRLWGF